MVDVMDTGNISCFPDVSGFNITAIADISAVSEIWVLSISEQ